MIEIDGNNLVQDIPQTISTIPACFCSMSSVINGITNQCFNMPNSIISLGTLISFEFQMSICWQNSLVFDISVFGPSPFNLGALAFEYSALSSGQLILDKTSLVYEYGWPGFDVNSQLNQICFTSSSFVCISSFSYQLNYLTTLASYSTYSGLACVSVSPAVIGLNWFVHLNFQWFGLN